MRNRRNQPRQRSGLFKQNLKLTKPDPATWPPIRSEDLQMVPVDDPEDGEDGVRYFSFQWSDKRREANELFQACIETGDPNSLFGLLGKYPYHVSGVEWSMECIW